MHLATSNIRKDDIKFLCANASKIKSYLIAVSCTYQARGINIKYWKLYKARIIIYRHTFPIGLLEQIYLMIIITGTIIINVSRH